MASRQASRRENPRSSQHGLEEARTPRPGRSRHGTNAGDAQRIAASMPNAPPASLRAEHRSNPPSSGHIHDSPVGTARPYDGLDSEVDPWADANPPTQRQHGREQTEEERRPLPRADVASLVVAYRRKHANRAGSGGTAQGHRSAASRERRDTLAPGSAAVSDRGGASVREGAPRASSRPNAAVPAHRLFDPDRDPIPTASGAQKALAAASHERKAKAAGKDEDKAKRRDAIPKKAEIVRKGPETEPKLHTAGSDRTAQYFRDDRPALRVAAEEFPIPGHERRSRGGRSRSEHDSVATTGRSKDARQLFDPKRDDPVTFAASQTRRVGVSNLSQVASTHSGSVTGTTSGTSFGLPLMSGADSRSAVSTAPTGSIYSNEASRERRRRKDAEHADDVAGVVGRDLGSRLASGMGLRSEGARDRDFEVRSGARSGDGAEIQARLRELQRIYKDIVDLEERLQQEHTKARESGRERGVRLLSRELGDGVDHAFWVKIEGDHKRLADMMAHFMEQALRPGSPAPISSYPTKYNIATRLWHTGFHMMLERLRRSLPPWPSASSAQSSLASEDGTAKARSAILDHLYEFIYYAYSFYTNLLESETFKSFRTVWMENLGDLARYRMAIMGLYLTDSASTEPSESLASTSAATRAQRSQIAKASPRSRSPVSNDVRSRVEVQGKGGPHRLSLQNVARIDDDESAANQTYGGQGDSLGHAKESVEAPRGVALGQSQAEESLRAPADVEVVQAQPPQAEDQASIGQEALGSWELEERETWKTTARDWYAKALAEMPGTGRLHHHLGLLSRGEDDLRTLHHFCKSMTSSHPYGAARESLLPLFDREMQARRLEPSASAVELFVHLHGMLFTRVQLDDFAKVSARFATQLRKAVRSISPRPEALRKNRGAKTTLTEVEWMMMGTITIASLLQYGAEDAILHRADLISATAGTFRGTTASLTGSSSRSGASEGRSASGIGDAPSEGISGVSEALSTLSVHPEDMESPRMKCSSPEGKSVAIADVPARFDELPVGLQCAVQLASSIMRIAIESILHDQPRTPKLNGYITTLLIFIATTLKQPASASIIERYVPWELLVDLATRSPVPMDPMQEQPSKITGGQPLPEDWCLRGMAWVGRRVYERGFWKQRHGDSADPLLSPDAGALALTHESTSEVDILHADADDGDFGLAESSGDDLAIESRSDSRSSSISLRRLRWNRFAYVVDSMAKSVAGLDYDATSYRLVIVSPLSDKIAQWSAADGDDGSRDAAGGPRQVMLDVASASPEEEDDEEEESEDDKEDEDDAHDSEQVRQLKARRRELKAILRSARLRTDARAGSGRAGGEAATSVRPAAGKGAKKARLHSETRDHSPRIVPGYTVLVFDTNVIVAGGAILERLVESQHWTVVVPLAVVTELDGLKRNYHTEVGREAARMIEYLELKLRTHSMFLRIHTSRNNYLSDLTIRAEDIDFGAGGDSTGPTQPGGPGPGIRHARSLDEVILQSVEWQQRLFVDRSRLLANAREADRNFAAHRSVARPQTSAQTSPAPSAAVLTDAQGPEASKAVLVTMDRALRLKARSLGVQTVGRGKELVNILALTSSTLSRNAASDDGPKSKGSSPRLAATSHEANPARGKHGRTNSRANASSPAHEAQSARGQPKSTTMQPRGEG